MGPCTKHPMAAKGPARTPLTGRNWAGSGPSPPKRTGFPSAGLSTAPTATTSACSNPPSTTSPRPASSSTSRPSTWTGATTTPSYANGSPRSGSATSTSNAAAPKNPAATGPYGSGSAGSWKPPTRGGRTTANSAATPTAATTTDTPPSASPPPSSSPANSSTTATDGAPADHLPAQALSIDLLKAQLSASRNADAHSRPTLGGVDPDRRRCPPTFADGSNSPCGTHRPGRGVALAREKPDSPRSSRCGRWHGAALPPNSRRPCAAILVEARQPNPEKASPFGVKSRTTRLSTGFPGSIRGQGVLEAHDRNPCALARQACPPRPRRPAAALRLRSLQPMRRL